FVVGWFCGYRKTSSFDRVALGRMGLVIPATRLKPRDGTEVVFLRVPRESLKFRAALFSIPTTQPAFLFPHCTASTVSLRPMAFVTATSVESRGLPCTDKARYRLSRSMPAALATLAIPWACA